MNAPRSCVDLGVCCLGMKLSVVNACTMCVCLCVLKPADTHYAHICRPTNFHFASCIHLASLIIIRAINSAAHQRATESERVKLKPVAAVAAVHFSCTADKEMQSSSFRYSTECENVNFNISGHPHSVHDTLHITQHTHPHMMGTYNANFTTIFEYKCILCRRIYERIRFSSVTIHALPVYGQLKFDTVKPLRQVRN